MLNFIKYGHVIPVLSLCELSLHLITFIECFLCTKLTDIALYFASPLQNIQHSLTFDARKVVMRLLRFLPHGQTHPMSVQRNCCCYDFSLKNIRSLNYHYN